ncbi:MAG: TlyA family RNA methyltransferase [Erysipelotrichaceae bacterium]
MRLDIYLTENKYFNTRSQASLAIKENRVKVNNRFVSKAGYEVNENDIVSIIKPQYNFVSRGGYKLLEAIEKFKIDLKDKIVLDIGASTGGFTDCALQFGCKKVYAFDVGENQLDQSLRNHKQVIVREKINCRYLSKDDIADTVDYIVMDVSFISATKLFQSISNILNTDAKAVILFKPQFEVGKEYLTNANIVNNDKIVVEKLNDFIKEATAYDLYLIGFTCSPIRGKEGNKEYLLYFNKGSTIDYIKEVNELC